VEGEPLGPTHHYGSDRILVAITLEGEPDADLDRLLTEWTRRGRARVRIELPDRDSIAAEFYRWEVATALAGALLGINPFDEPNVQESKDATREILDELVRTGSLPGSSPRTRGDGVEIHASDELWMRLTSGVPSMPSLELVLNRLLALAAPGDYLAVLAYVERTASTEASFALLRRAIRNAIHLPVLQGYGPRYLHSIGQLFKGGPPNGLFLEITANEPSDLAIPASRTRSASSRWPRRSGTCARSSGTGGRCFGFTWREGSRPVSLRRAGRRAGRLRPLRDLAADQPQERHRRFPLGRAKGAPAVHDPPPRHRDLGSLPRRDREGRRDRW
jgi:hypothetical protein